MRLGKALESMGKHIVEWRSILCLLLLVATYSAGCDSKDKRSEAQKKIIDDSNRLNMEYLRGDANSAHASLIKNASLLEHDSGTLEPIGRAGLLYFVYSRLYVFEQRQHKDAEAGLALVKAKYWYLTSNELDGQALDKTFDAIKGFSSEYLCRYVDDLDEKHNGGKRAAYTQTLTDK